MVELLSKPVASNGGNRVFANQISSQCSRVAAYFWGHRAVWLLAFVHTAELFGPLWGGLQRKLEGNTTIWGAFQPAQPWRQPEQPITDSQLQKLQASFIADFSQILFDAIGSSSVDMQRLLIDFIKADDSIPGSESAKWKRSLMQAAAPFCLTPESWVAGGAKDAIRPLGPNSKPYLLDFDPGEHALKKMDFTELYQREMEPKIREGLCRRARITPMISLTSTALFYAQWAFQCLATTDRSAASEQ